MDPTRPLDAETAEIAQRALHEAVISLLEAAVELAAGAEALEEMPKVSQLCADADLLARSLGVVRERVGR